MKVLSILYKDKVVIKHRVNSPLILVGRSPLCDMVIRTPGINSVHFILEWIGTTEFSIDTCPSDEWVITLVQTAPASEKKINKTATGEGFIFHEKPMRIDEYTFQWQDDRLVEADLSSKMLSQQISEIKENVYVTENGSNKLSTVLEVICVSQDVDSVNEIYHYNLNSKNYKVDECLTPFGIKVESRSKKKVVSFQIPTDAVTHVIRQGMVVDLVNESRVSIEQNDLLHVQWDIDAFYFRIVPRVSVPLARKSIFSDPFYIITTICLITGAMGFYFMSSNIRNEKIPPVIPPRIAEIQITEVIKPIPIQPLAETPPPPPPPPPLEKPPDEMTETLKNNNGKPNENPKPEVKPVELVPNQIPGVKTVDKVSGPLTQKDKGGMAAQTEKGKSNTVGFMSAFKSNKKLGLVKADQIINNGVVAHTVTGKDSEVLLDQSAQGLVNKDVRKEGDSLAAASTRVNLKDKVGMNSIEGKERNVLKEGFNISFGDAGGGSLGDAKGETNIETVVEGGLDKASVKSAISGYKNEIRTCFERALRLKSAINGRVIYKFQISSNGSTQWVQILKSDVDSSTLVSCVQDVIKNIVFPKAKNGQNTIVIYPFQFAKKGG